MPKPNNVEFSANELQLVSEARDEWVNRTPVVNEPVMLASGGPIMFVVGYNDDKKSITVEWETNKHTFPRQCLYSMLIQYTLIP